MKNNHRPAPLFFSMTYEFLEVYLSKQCGRSPHTVESYRDALSLFRRYIFNSVDISLQSSELEVKRVPQCRMPKTEKTVIPEDAMTAILRQPSNTKMGLRDRTIMILLYDSGARLAEVLGLNVSDVAIDGDNPYIRVNGKGGKQRIVPISAKTAAHIASYISVYHTRERQDTELLFFTVIKDITGMMSEGNVERFVKEYARKAQAFCPSVPDHVHPHMFRRTRATQLYQNGVSLPLVSRLLGHASLETTRLYAKPSLKMLRDAIESVETSEQEAVKPIWEGNEAMMAKLSGLR